LESENLIWGNRIVVNNLNYEIDGLNRSRNFWRKKYESLADELEDQIAVLENKLRDTVTLKYHDETVATATRRISILIIERDAFQRLAGDLQTEKSCMRADLENVCKEQEALKSKIDELEEELGSKDDDWRLSISYYMNLAAVWEKRAEEMRAKLKKFEAFFTGED
jgi:chromosome segregation ATPase